MKESVKASLLMALENACNDSGEVAFRDSYSGRGMYGSECIGIVGSHSDCQRILAFAVKALGEELVDEAESERGGTALDTFNDAVDALFDYSTDSMGRDGIMYWPHISSEPVESESDE